MKARKPLETLLAATLAATVVLQIYFFLIIHQNWSLMDDYAFVNRWAAPDSNQWQLAARYLEHLLATGRFQPVDALSRAIHFRYFPVTPRAFHLGQFVLVGGAAALAAFLRRLRFSRSQILFALVLVGSNLALKDWLTKITCSEGLATPLLMLSLWLYASGRKWWSLPVFALSFCSKESFFVACACFPILELIFFGSDPRKRPGAFLPAFAAVLMTGAFAFFIRSLPRVYTASLDLSKLSTLGLARSLWLPPARCFGPALILSALALWLRHRAGQKITRGELAAASLGAWLIVAFTVLLSAWGPFDSWFYLHTPIPWAWALVLGASLGSSTVVYGNRYVLILAASCLVYFTASVANGGRNLTNFHANAKTMAELACQDSERVADLKVLSNCNEGSTQLEAYLNSGGVCASPPHIFYAGTTEQLRVALARSTGKVELLLATNCDPLDPASAGFVGRTQLVLGTWRLLKNY